MLRIRHTAAVITFIIAIIFCSCKPKVKETPPPAILEGKKIDVSSILKKRGNDVVDALYVELVSNSEELKELENQIKKLKQQAADSLEDFKTFNDKNTSYYTSADNKTGSIRDSSLRKKIRGLITKSRYNYRDSASQWITLDSLINRRAATINDLHTLLKLVKTLPLIEEFQRSNKPASIPTNKMVTDYDSLINRLDSLTKLQPVKK